MSFADLEMKVALAAGAVTARSVRIWARVDAPGPVTIELSTPDGESEQRRVEATVSEKPGDCTAAWSYPDDFPNAPPLRPSTRYRARLLRHGEALAEAEFQTAPESRLGAPRRWSFGALSCHQPFARDGSPHEGGRAMLSTAHRALKNADARFVLMMGDQLYADYPPRLSLFEPKYFSRIAPPGKTSLKECSRQQVRSIYQQRYRQFWALPEFQRLLSSFATYPILDDHEIVDNFGTDPRHADQDWESVRQGALDAYFDYQGSRVLSKRSASSDYGFTWGPAAFYVLDIRSQRRTVGSKTTVFSPAQLTSLKEFLDRQSGAALLGLVTTVPLVYLETRIVKATAALFSQGSDLHERWSHPSCLEARNELFDVLIEHARRNPNQLILLLGGDVHSGAAYQVDFDDGVRMYQLVSSAISNRESMVLTKASEFASRSVNGVSTDPGRPDANATVLRGERGYSQNPFGGLNLGLVDVEDRGQSVAVRLRLMTYVDSGIPNCVFDSGPLLPGR